MQLHFPHKAARRLFPCVLLLLALALPSAAGAQEADPCAALQVVILGDSNSWLGGDGCDKPRGWNTWFRSELKPAGCRSYARSGATWTHTERTKRNTEENTGRLSDDNVIYNQICRLLEAVEAGKQARPDLILISAGTNDAWFPDQRPGALVLMPHVAFAADSLLSRPANAVLTLAEAVRWDCEMLKSAFPEARIVLLTPMQSTSIADDQITLAGNIIEGCARCLSLSVIRLDRDAPVRSAAERKHFRYTYDGTHTSEAGAQAVGRLAATRIRMLYR